MRREAWKPFAYMLGLMAMCGAVAVWLPPLARSLYGAWLAVGLMLQVGWGEAPKPCLRAHAALLLRIHLWPLYGRPR